MLQLRPFSPFHCYRLLLAGCMIALLALALAPAGPVRAETAPQPVGQGVPVPLAADEKVDPSFVLSVDPLSSNGWMVGYPIRVTVDLSGTRNGSNLPTGTVTIGTGSGPGCSIPLDGGAGGCTLFFTAHGAFTVTASYPGDTNFNARTVTQAIYVNALSLAPRLTAGRNHTCLLGSTGQFSCWGFGDNFPSAETDVFTTLAAGHYHTCGIKTDGTLECWSESVAINTVPAGRYIALSAYGDYACAIDLNNRLHCWGDLPAAIATSIPTTPVKAVTTGESHVCAIRVSDSEAVCWAPAGNANLSEPNQDVQAIAAGRTHTCAITAAGGVTCWGSFSANASSSTYSQLSSGSDYACALNALNQISCWGPQASSLGVNASGTYSSLGSGFLHLCALHNEQAGGPTLACWGGNAFGQAPRLSLTPTVLAATYWPTGRPWSQSFTPAGSTSAGNYTLVHSSGTLPAGTSFNGSSLSGTPTSAATYNFSLSLSETNLAGLPLRLQPLTQSYTLTVQNPATTLTWTAAPTAVTAGEPAVVQVQVTRSGTPTYTGRVTIASLDNEASCQVTVPENGQVSCTLYFRTAGDKPIQASFTGDDFYTASQSTTRTITVNRPNLTPQVSAGHDFTCSINSDGTPVCWGRNESGQSTPPSTAILSSLSAGGSHVCGRDLSSRVVCWGWDGYGMVSSAPSGYGYQSVGSGLAHACALSTSGAVTCWGITDARTTQTPAGTGYSALTVGDRHSCVLNAAGSAVCWGTNTDGQASAPTGAFSRISAGGNFTCGIHTDGSLECWGGSGAIQTEPAGGFSALDAGGQHACALTAGGLLSCWGSGPSAPSGLYQSVSAGGAHTCAISTGEALVCWGSNTHGQAPFLTLSPVSFPTINVGQTWTGQITAAGGRTLQTSYQISTGSLPAGLFLDNATGRLSGTPGQPGFYPFTVTAVEGEYQPALTRLQSYSLTVRSQVQVSLSGLPTGPVSTGSPVTVQLQVGETPGGRMDASPTGQVTLQTSDGQQCAPTLVNGSAACTFFFTTPGTVAFNASYPGDDLFLAGATTAASEITVEAYQQSPALVSSAEHTYVYRADGSLGCFGSHCNLPQLANRYTTLAAGESQTCVIGLDGRIRCVAPDGAVLGAPAGFFQDLAVGAGHGCAINLAGMVTCWGDNTAGQATAPGGQFTRLSAAGNTTCGIRADGSLACWGSLTSSAPGNTFTWLAAAADHACALTATGMPVCWGEDGLGQSTPPTGQVFAQIAVGTGFSCGLDADGHITCWGDPAYPAPEGSFTTLTAASDHACALRPAIKKTCWGLNQFGEAPQFSVSPIGVASIPALQAWEHRFNPTGGVKPFSSTLNNGSVPTGLTLTLSQSGLVLSGTPTVPDDYSFVLRWEDSSEVPNVLELTQNLTVTGADLQVELLAGHPGPVLTNNPVEIRISYTNNGALTVPQARLTVTLPENLANLTTAGTPCTRDGSRLTCELANLAPHSCAILTLSGGAPFAADEAITTQAAIQMLSSGWTETAPANNQATLTLTTQDQRPLLSDSFDDAAPAAGWTDAAIVAAPSGEQVLGQADLNTPLALRLTGLAPHQRLKIRFVLYIVGPWPGILADTPEDSSRWTFGLDGEPALLDATFANLAEGRQSFPLGQGQGSFPAQTGALALDTLGNPGTADARYLVELTIPHTAADLNLIFNGLNLPPGASWAIDDFELTLESGKQFVFLPAIVR